MGIKCDRFRNGVLAFRLAMASRCDPAAQIGSAFLTPTGRGVELAEAGPFLAPPGPNGGHRSSFTERALGGSQTTTDDTQGTAVRHTPLFEEHSRLGGRMVDFHGWEMPIQYGSILEEHRTVRTLAGLFDVSHMGEIRVTGARARAFLDHLLTNRMDDLRVGRARYSPMTDERGGTVDDLLVYALGEEEFLVVVNASNQAADLAWIEVQAVPFGADVRIRDLSPQVGEIALQGPRAVDVMGRLLPDTTLLRPFRFLRGRLDDREVLVSRTGYTGEDGFEIYAREQDIVALWRRVLAEGGPEGVAPAGLGARDTLRLEAALPLYGQELAPDLSPLAAGLDRFVALDVPGREFVGRSALVAEREAGIPRRIVGLTLLERAVPRTGYAVVERANGKPQGHVTSGVIGPTVGSPIALAVIGKEALESGTPLAIEIRGRRIPCEVTPTPFYRRPRAGAAS